jgi:pimeloyl-ACP methyl ester carboxylesterase
MPMENVKVQVYSDGLRLDGRLYLPDDHVSGDQHPLVVACSGFTGLYQIHPARFARWLTRRNYACFSVDYRGYGQSEGPRFRVILEEQVRDIRCAVSVALGSRYVDQRNVFLLGWAMGAGLVVDAAHELDSVKGICALNGLYDGLDFQRSHRGDTGLAEFRERITAERARRAATGIAEYVDPFDIYPLDEITRGYVRSSLDPLEAYEATTCSFELAESLLRWSVLPVAPRVRLPLFLAHGEVNALHPPGQAAALADVYGGPIDVHWLNGAGHTEWMQDDNPIFTDLCERLYRWLEAHRTH